MHLRCVSITIKNLWHFLLIISLAFQTSYSQQKESIPEFENFPIIDSESDRSEEDIRQGSDEWIPQSSSSRNSFDGVGYERVRLPNGFSSPDEVVNHMINSGVIENLDTEELEKISNKYHNNYDNNNDENTRNQNKDFKPEEDLPAFRNKNRWHSSELLRHLLDVYKLKSSGILAKRGEGPQLSIVNPLDVLRQRLLLELARRRMKENQDQIQANAEILKKIGRRRRKRSIRSSETIPQQTVRHSAKELIIKKSTKNNRYLSDRGVNYRFLNTNTNKNSLNKCQKCRRKKM